MASDIILNDHNIDAIGSVDVKASENADTTIRLEPKHGNIKVGGEDADGDLWMKDQEGNVRIELDSGSGEVKFPDTNRVHVDGKGGNLTLGGNGADGDLWVKDKNGNYRVELSGTGSRWRQGVRFYVDGKEANILLGGEGADGDLWLKDQDGTYTIELDAGSGNQKFDTTRIHLDGKRGDINLISPTLDAPSIKVRWQLIELERPDQEIERLRINNPLSEVESGIRTIGSDGTSRDIENSDEGFEFVQMEIDLVEEVQFLRQQVKDLNTRLNQLENGG